MTKRKNMSFVWVDAYYAPSSPLGARSTIMKRSPCLDGPGVAGREKAVFPLRWYDCVVHKIFLKRECLPYCYCKIRRNYSSKIGRERIKYLRNITVRRDKCRHCRYKQRAHWMQSEGRQNPSLETCVTWGQGGLLHALYSESDMVRFTLERDLTDCCVDGEFKSGPGLRHRNWVSALPAWMRDTKKP